VSEHVVRAPDCGGYPKKVTEHVGRVRRNFGGRALDQGVLHSLQADYRGSFGDRELDSALSPVFGRGLLIGKLLRRQALPCPAQKAGETGGWVVGERSVKGGSKTERSTLPVGQVANSGAVFRGAGRGGLWHPSWGF